MSPASLVQAVSRHQRHPEIPNPVHEHGQGCRSAPPPHPSKQQSQQRDIQLPEPAVLGMRDGPKDGRGPGDQPRSPSFFSELASPDFIALGLAECALKN